MERNRCGPGAEGGNVELTFQPEYYIITRNMGAIGKPEKTEKIRCLGRCKQINRGVVMEIQITREMERAVEIMQIRKKDAAFDARMAQLMKWDEKYAAEGDAKLTPEQKAAVDAYWGKYKFAFKVNYATFEAYMNRTGKFDPRYIPYGLRKGILAPYIRDDNYRWPFQNKAYFSSIYINVKQPETVCRKLEGIYLDKDFNQITADEAAALCLKALKTTEIVIKPSGLSGGAGVVFLEKANKKQILQEFKKITGVMIVQRAVKQHPELAKLNPSTVNTVRLTTYLDGKKVVPLAALIKIGNAGVRVDNYKHGGHILGIHMNGKAYDYALNVDYEKVTVLPTGVDLSKGIRIPGFDNVLQTATKAHLDTPRIKVISWDIAIDDKAEAVIIEANHGGDFRMHQVLTGPLFGDLTESFLEKYLVKNFFRERANQEWNFNEYFHHVELTKYAGDETHVKVPETVNGKPVKAIRSDTFMGNNSIVSVELPSGLTRLYNRAFNRCGNLSKVTGGANLKTMGENTFKDTPKMKQADRMALRMKAKANQLMAGAKEE